jgi:hypothetical protein
MRAVFADTKVLTIETSGRLMARVQSLQEILTHIPGSEPALIKNWLLAIKRTLSGMIRDLGGESVFSGALARLVDRVHRLKIKVDILRLRLKLGAMDMLWLTQKILSVRRWPKSQPMLHRKRK